MGFRACPIWIGCNGLTLVCSTMIFVGLSVFMKPYSCPSWSMDSRVNVGEFREVNIEVYVAAR